MDGWGLWQSSFGEIKSKERGWRLVLTLSCVWGVTEGLSLHWVVCEVWLKALLTLSCVWGVTEGLSLHWVVCEAWFKALLTLSCVWGVTEGLSLPWVVCEAWFKACAYTEFCVRRDWRLVLTLSCVWGMTGLIMMILRTGVSEILCRKFWSDSRLTNGNCRRDYKFDISYCNCLFISSFFLCDVLVLCTGTDFEKTYVVYQHMCMYW